MTTTTQTRFRLHAIAPESLQQVRTTGLDVSGQPVEHVDGEGLPLRRCLRNSTAGEKLMLFGYEPALPPSPYREIGAVYAHAEPCQGPDHTDRYPSDWHGRPQVFRAYDDRGWIHHQATRVHDGTNPEQQIVEIFAHPEVTQIHTRNVAAGCYMLRITRPDRG
ncbi:MAG: DUF1203 domain-containing protein [Streptosporangiales bacterium]|nr:DUF1203 domain-containing protein [Streptosporangiales bacterium]